MNLKGRHFLTLKDFTKEEIMEQVGFQEQYFDSEVVM